MTKKYRRLSIMFATLSMLVTILPALVCLIVTLCYTDNIQRYVCICILIACVILSIAALITKCSCRAICWLMFVGICYVGKNILLIATIMAALVLVDEFVLQPLHKHYHNLAVINNEIDKRGL